MNTVTTRALRKTPKASLPRGERGEILQVTRRRPVARRAPAQDAGQPAPWSDLAARAALLSGGKPLKGSPAADLVIAGR